MLEEGLQIMERRQARQGRRNHVTEEVAALRCTKLVNKSRGRARRRVSRLRKTS